MAPYRAGWRLHRSSLKVTATTRRWRLLSRHSHVYLASLLSQEHLARRATDGSPLARPDTGLLPRPLVERSMRCLARMASVYYISPCEDPDGATARGPGGGHRDRVSPAPALEVRRRPRPLESGGWTTLPACRPPRDRRSRRLGGWPPSRSQCAGEGLPEGHGLWPEARWLTPGFSSPC